MSEIETLITALRARRQALRGLGYKVRFALEDTGESILLDATLGQVDVSEADGAADTVLRLSAADLGRLATGRLSPMLAYATGRLKIEGSKGVAMKLASLLDEEG